jgi:hypothetical protein
MNLITNVRELVASGLPQIVAAVLQSLRSGCSSLRVVLVATRAGSDADNSGLEVIPPMAMEERRPYARVVSYRSPQSPAAAARRTPQSPAAAARHPPPAMILAAAASSNPPLQSLAARQNRQCSRCQNRRRN